MARAALRALTCASLLAVSVAWAADDRPLAERLLAEELRTRGAWQRLAHLTDRIGPRLSGSAGERAAVQWAAETLTADGFSVRREPVTVPHWVRGEEQAEVIAPAHRLVVTALGGSVGTPPHGVEAEVVVADGLDDLERLGESVQGRIVLFNRAMTNDDSPAAFRAYRDAATQRTRGPSAAARKGAVAVLVRSLGTLSARLPHTGATRYDADAPQVPAAAITAEDADLLARLVASGTLPRVRLRLGCRTLEDVPSANVVADLVGGERPDEVVLIAAHLDSWDLGTGAHDDGAGVAMVMESLRLLKGLGRPPRRTIRAVLYANEENGLAGARAYAAAHAGELTRHVAALETDSGAFVPLGFRAWVGPGGVERLGEMVQALAGLGATRITPATEVGADIGPLKPAGVPLLGLDVDGRQYFHWHHTPADTLDKVDPELLAKDAVVLATMAWMLAEAPEPLPRPSPPPPSPSPSPAAAPALPR
jgi:carboxypeptidase Q